MLWVYTPRCPVYTACMRQAWVNLVHRTAEGRQRILDNRRLYETLAALDLTTGDFAADVEAAGTGKPESSPRLRGEWPTLSVYQAAAFENEGIAVIGEQP